jgi:hypothetical protein
MFYCKANGKCVAYCNSLVLPFFLVKYLKCRSAFRTNKCKKVLRSDVKCRLFLLNFLYRKDNLDLVFKWYSSRLVPLTLDLGMVPYDVELACEI